MNGTERAKYPDMSMGTQTIKESKVKEKTIKQEKLF
jgi:hypothetical protein